MCDEEYLEVAIDCIRHQVELCDSLPIFLLINSIGGGTGSGLGSRITEVIADKVSLFFEMNPE